MRSNEPTMYLDVENHILRYVTHIEVRMRFPSVVTTDSLGDSRKVILYCFFCFIVKVPSATGLYIFLDHNLPLF